MSLRRSTRRSLTRMAAWSGVLSRCERRMRDDWTILTYHRVLADGHGYPFELLVTPEEEFRAQARWLAERCRLVTVAEGLRLVRSGEWKADERPLVSLTIDDGYVDGYETVAGVLEEWGARGTFFVTAGPVGSTARLWFDVAARRFRAASGEAVREAMRMAGAHASGALPGLAEWMRALKGAAPALRERMVGMLAPTADEAGTETDRLMSPEELRGLVKRGHEVGSHTVRHPILPLLGDEELEEEVAGARKQIGAWVGQPAAGFCYPNGDHDHRVVGAVERAGYAYACTTRGGRNGPGTDPMRLMRVDMNPGRTTRADGRHDELAFRAEVCLLRGSGG